MVEDGGFIGFGGCGIWGRGGRVVGLRVQGVNNFVVKCDTSGGEDPHRM